MTHEQRNSLRDMRGLNKQFYGEALRQVGLKLIDIHEGMPQRGLEARVLFSEARKDSKMFAIPIDRFTTFEALLTVANSNQRSVAALKLPKDPVDGAEVTVQ